MLCCASPAGDHALGYDIANANLVNMDFEAHVNRGGAVPDVVLVRKSYEEKRRKTRGRAGRSWKLKHLPIEAGEDRWAAHHVAHYVAAFMHFVGSCWFAIAPNMVGSAAVVVGCGDPQACAVRLCAQLQRAAASIHNALP